MKNYAVEYRRYDAINNETVLDTKWFAKYETAAKFAKKHFTRVYDGREIIDRNHNDIRSGKIKAI